MPLRFYPKAGHILLCDFERGFVAPEMVKNRPVVVLSHKETHNRRLCTVVPLSTSTPAPLAAWHYRLAENPLPAALGTGNRWAEAEDVWVKGDMLYTVSFERLDKFHKKTRAGREYVAPTLTPNDFHGVCAAVKAYLRF